MKPDILRDMNIALAVAIIYAQVVDFVITYYVVYVTGIGIEVNPVIRYLVFYFGWGFVGVIKFLIAFIWMYIVMEEYYKQKIAVMIGNFLTAGFYFSFLSWMVYNLFLRSR